MGITSVNDSMSNQSLSDCSQKETKRIFGVCDPGFEAMEIKRQSGEITEEAFQKWYSEHCAKCQLMAETCMAGEE